MIQRFVAVVVFALAVVACSSSDQLAMVDGVEIVRVDLNALHVEPDDLDADERAGSALLLVLREAFESHALLELDLSLNVTAVDAAYETRIAALEGRGDLHEVLAARNETTERIRIQAELDTLRDSVAEELVRSESARFDLDTAYQQFLLDNAEVCIRQMQLGEDLDFDIAVGRLDAGEDFADVARDISIDPFVDRTEGVGAGGDLGCSAPSALPSGLAEATLEARIGDVAGPILSDVGLFLLVVYERDMPELDAVRPEVIEHAIDRQGPTLFRLWAIDVLTTIEVEIDGSIGEWGILPETMPVPTVVPPYRTGDII